MNMQHRPGVFKVKFTPAEDQKLRELVKRLGLSNWIKVAEQMTSRNARQCRERWNNYLSPALLTHPWTPDEDILLDQKYAQVGSKWTYIAGFFPDRSRNNIKNRWKTRRNNQRREAGYNPLATSTGPDPPTAAQPTSGRSESLFGGPGNNDLLGDNSLERYIW
jgi:hypothetical protein